jgi:SAM-dependent methyltransferase
MEKMKKTIHIYLFIVFFLFIAGAYVSLNGRMAFPQAPPAAQKEIKLDVPYEPSSEDVVRTMLEIANVGKEDIVYDLGCGDGRVVIAAAQKTGARGVGVDLDPERIKESHENARRANVTDRVKFYRNDLFQTEISEATVVMLYLYPEVNLKLRPKLYRELKPGTRVVSHSHDMGTWEPDQTKTVPNGHRVHFWTIPANVTGTWEWDMPGEWERYVLRLNQRFQKISGTLQIGSYEIPVKDPELKGARVQFTIERVLQGQVQAWVFSGHLQGHYLEGTVQGIIADAQGRQIWKATRNPSSMISLEF